MNKKEIKEEINKIKKEIVELTGLIATKRERIATIKSKCTHDIIQKGQSAYCDVCGDYLGWYCDESPTKTCDYEQEDGEYDEDNCIYCGMPEERK